MQFFSSSTPATTNNGPALAPPPGTLAGSPGGNAQEMYIFNRAGACLLHREWHHVARRRSLDPTQDHKLMFGLLFSLRSFTAKMDPTAEKGNLGVPLLPGQGCSFHSFRTNTYKLSYMESPSGIKLILITHPRTGDQWQDSLRHIYNLYVEYVVKNPLYDPAAPVKSDLFHKNLDQFIKTLI